MDRRRDDRRPARDDNRNHRPRYEQDRSRSPPRRDRRDDRRRDRSTHRSGPPPPRGAPSSRNDRDYQRNRDVERNGSTRGRPGDKPPQRGVSNGKTNDPKASEQQDLRGSKEADTRMEDIPEDEDSEAEMARVMGFKDFRSTKNTKVPGNSRNFGVYKVKQAEYRQYMNRVGGFNRPLSPSRT